MIIMMAFLCVLYLIEAKNQSSNYLQARIRGYLAKAESQLKEETLSKNQELLVQDMVSYSRFDRELTPHSGSRLQKQTKSSQISWQLL